MRNALLSAVALAMVLAPLAPRHLLAAPAAVAETADLLTLPAPKAGRVKPLIVVVAGRGGAETTDFTIPYGVLTDSGVADVRSLSTVAGPVQLRSALRVKADHTTAEFDADEPAGADIVIVPAQMSPKEPALIAWVQAQAAKGAVVMSICEGSRVLANARLLDGRRATSHWAGLPNLDKEFPRTTWVRDRRYVQDGSVISTTGVSASIPASLALVEAIGGRTVAAETAARLGVSDWSPVHRTADFALEKGDISGGVRTALAVWSHETVEFPLADDIDEVSLALNADAWTRTLRSKVVTTSSGAKEVRSRHGLIILPDARPKAKSYVVPITGGAVPQLHASFTDMDHRYGPAASHLAKLGMEYSAGSVAP